MEFSFSASGLGIACLLNVNVTFLRKASQKYFIWEIYLTGYLYRRTLETQSSHQTLTFEIRDEHGYSQLLWCWCWYSIENDMRWRNIYIQYMVKRWLSRPLIRQLVRKHSLCSFDRDIIFPKYVFLRYNALRTKNKTPHQCRDWNWKIGYFKILYLVSFHRIEAYKTGRLSNWISWAIYFGTAAERQVSLEIESWRRQLERMKRNIKEKLGERNRYSRNHWSMRYCLGCYSSFKGRTEALTICHKGRAHKG